MSRVLSDERNREATGRSNNGMVDTAHALIESGAVGKVVVEFCS